MLKKTLIILFYLASAFSVQVHAQSPADNASTYGTGTHPSLSLSDPSLPEQVIYRPKNLGRLNHTKLGLYVFGNGGCTDDAASSRLHLLEVASHGYLAIAPGRIYSGPGAIERRVEASANRDNSENLSDAATYPEQLKQAIDWALLENADKNSPYFNKIDPNAIAISGFSCGGLQALMNANDPRVNTAIIMNSGIQPEGVMSMAGMSVTNELLNDLHFPTLYILGGPTDIAYENGMDDFKRIKHVPVAVANINKGHGGTYQDPNGGVAATVVVNWLNWVLRDDATAGAMFLGENCGLCNDPAWEFEKKKFD